MQIQGRTVRRGLLKLTFDPSRILIYLVVGTYALTTILAFGWIIMISLKSNMEFVATSPWALPQIFQWANYVNAWRYAGIDRYFLNTIIVATVGAGVSVLISAMAAYVLSRIPFRLSWFFSKYFLIGLMVPLILCVIPIFFMAQELGILGTGLTPLILIYIASGIPFNTFMLSSYIGSLPYEMEEAAALDGASPFRTFWQIMMPLAVPGLVAVFFINFVSLWNEFFLAMIFLRGDSMTLAVGLFSMLRRAEYAAAWSELFAGMIISVVPVLIIFGVLQRQITKGLTVGALKG